MTRKLLQVTALTLIAMMVFLIQKVEAQKPVIAWISTKLSNGLVCFQDGRTKKFGYLDTNGNIALPAKYETSGDFVNGYTRIQNIKTEYGYSNEFIDTQGNVILKPKSTSKKLYQYLSWNVEYGIAKVMSLTKKNATFDKYCLVNSKGQILTNQEYDDYGMYGYGYIPVRQGSIWYHVDAQGNPLGTYTWSHAGGFYEEIASVAIKVGKSQKWGAINTKGEMVIPPEYETALYFANGLSVADNGQKKGYIDKNGETIIEFLWDQADLFRDNGYAIVKREGCSYLIDKNGTIQFASDEYKTMTYFGCGLYKVGNGIAYGLIDSTGTVILPVKYKSIAMGADNQWYAAETFAIPMIVNEKGDFVTILLNEGTTIEDKKETREQFKENSECYLLLMPYIEEKDITNYCFINQDSNVISMTLASKPIGEKFFVKWDSGKTQVFDNTGNRIGEKEWDEVKTGWSSQKLICVGNGQLYGYVDLTGKTIVKPVYTSFCAFDNGVTMGLIGNIPTFYDEDGQVLIPAITKSSDKEDIKRLQQALIDQGFLKGKADGDLGNMTKSAIMAAQREFGLDETGIADAALQRRLFGK